jgi:hypothetical protein
MLDFCVVFSSSPSLGFADTGRKFDTQWVRDLQAIRSRAEHAEAALKRQPKVVRVTYADRLNEFG